MKSAVLAFFSLATANWALCFADNQVKGTMVNCRLYPERRGNNLVCPRNFNPVCGTNQKTYGNKCLLCEFNLKNSLTIRKLHDGACIKCPQKENEICTMEYLPICGSDGIVYGNTCDFCNAFVKSKGAVTLSHYGEC